MTAAIDFSDEPEQQQELFELEESEPRADEEVEAIDEAAEEEAATEAIREKVRAARTPRSKARRAIVEERDWNLHDFLSQIGAGGDSMKISLRRKFPKVYIDEATGTTHQIEGLLGSYDEPITEEDIQEQHGGGTYAIAVQMPNERGKFTFVPGGHKTFKISGPPNVKSVIGRSAAPAGKSESDSTVKIAMDAMKDIMDRKGDSDPLMESMLHTMQTEMRELRKELASKDQKLLDVVTRRPEGNSHTERMLELLMGGESSRITTLHATHESELRAVRERAQMDADRQFQVLQSQIEDMKRSHDREITNLTRTHDAQIKQLETLHTASDKSFERELRHLDGLLTEAKSELATLRAQKIKSPIEMMEEVVTMRDALEGLSGGNEKEAPSSTLEKVIAGVAPVLEGIGRRFAEGGPPTTTIVAPAAPMTEADLPVGQPFRAPDGKVVVKQADGTMAEVRRKKKPAVEVGGKMIPLDPTAVRDAVRFMESAVGKQSPEMFASAVRHMIPPSLQEALAGPKGVDYFLDQVVNIEPSSQLATTAGRTWLREVAKHIFV